MRDIVLQHGAVAPISYILEQAHPDTNFLRNASWALSNLCRGTPTPVYHLVKKAIPALAKVIKENTHNDILIDTCWAFSYLSDSGDEALKSIMEQNILPFLIKLLNHEDIAIVVPSLRTLGNIATAGEKETQAIVNEGVLVALNNILFHYKKLVRKEACWTISNITAGSS